MKKKKLISLLLCVAMVLTLLPTAAFAAEPTPVAVKLHGKNIKDYEDKGSQPIAEWTGTADRTVTLQNAYDTVYLGGKAYYVLSMNGSSDNYTYYETKNPDGIHTTATYADDAGTAVDAANAMFLLSDANLGNSQFYSAKNDSHFWSKQSAAQGAGDYAGFIWDKLNGTAKTSYINTLFSDAERAAILKTTKKDVRVVTAKEDSFNYNGETGWSGTFNQLWTKETDNDTMSSDLLGDKLYPLSISEIINPAYGLNARQASRTYGAAAHWWLRSSGNTTDVGRVYSDSGLVSYNATASLAVRPAFNFNQSAIVFAADAAVENYAKDGTVGAMAPLAYSDTNLWKLTLSDTANFAVTPKLLAKGTAENSFVVIYEDAKLAQDAQSESLANVYVSAVLGNAAGDEFYGYTRLAAVTEDGQDGTATLTLSAADAADVINGDKKIYIFEEQANGTVKTDYAGALTKVPYSTFTSLSVALADDAPAKYVAGTTVFATDDLVVKEVFSNGYELVLADTDFTVTLPANASDNKFHILSAPVGADGEQQTVNIKLVGSEVATNTNITVMGIEQDAPNVGIASDGANWQLTGMTSAMQISENGTTWENYLSQQITGLANTTRYVRFAAHDDYAPGAVRTVTVPDAGAAVYTVTVTLSGIDAAEKALKTVDLIGHDTTPSYYDYDGSKVIVDGTYDVYVNNAYATDTEDTGVDVTVDGASASAEVTFVPITFDYNIEGVEDDVTNVLSGVSYDAATEIAKANTLAGKNGLSFTAFADAAPYTVTEAKTVKAQYTVLSATDTAELSVTELSDGNAIPTPDDTTLTYGGNAYEQTGWTVNDAAISGNAVLNTAYTYKATFAPADGYTFTAVPTGLDSTWSLVGGSLVKTFAPITAGYPITVNKLPASVKSITYKLGSGEEKTVPAASGTAVISAPAQANYRLTVKDSDDVTYVGNVDLSGATSKTISCVSEASAIPQEELVQQAPALTMDPNKDSTGVTLSQKSVTVTVDQDVTLVGNKAQMYVYSTDANRENDVYTTVYEQTITSQMYDAKTRTLELNLASFRSGSNYLTTLTGNYSYKLVLAAGTVKGVNGVAQLDNDEFSAYFKPTASLGFTVQLLKPLNGNVYAYREGNTSVITGTGSLTAAQGDTVTVYAKPDVGYVFNSYTYKWNGVAMTQEDLVRDEVLTVDADDNSIVYVKADAASTLRVVANFNLDGGINEYTVTPDKDAYTVCVGSNVELTYVVRPNGTGLAFESSDSDVATVSGSTVYGISVGTATVTAKDPLDKVVAEWTITVVPAQTGRPQVSTDDAVETTITENSAVLSGSYTGTGFTVTEAGIVVKTLGGANQYFPMETVPADGSVSVAVKWLTPGATYYYSAYVKTANGTTYTGSEKSFTTLDHTGGGDDDSDLDIAKLATVGVAAAAGVVAGVVIVKIVVDRLQAINTPATTAAEVTKTETTVQTKAQAAEMPTVSVGDSNDAVKTLQTELNAQGYDCGEADGVFGQNTLNAVIAFQTANGLDADGVVGAQTWGALL